MAVLGLNCATENISLAILHNGQITEKNLTSETIKAEQLVLFLDELLKKVNLTLNDLKKIGIAIGPGAFTGLRLSLVTAKTIALAKQIPLVAVSTLEALAHQEKAKLKDHKKLRIILNACRGEVTTALFDQDLTRLEPDHALKENEINLLEKDTLIIKDPLAGAAVIASLAEQSTLPFEKNTILKLEPAYSHAARINKTNKQELRHLKISNLK